MRGTIGTEEVIGWLDVENENPVMFDCGPGFHVWRRLSRHFRVYLPFLSVVGVDMQAVSRGAETCDTVDVVVERACFPYGVEGARSRYRQIPYASCGIVACGFEYLHAESTVGEVIARELRVCVNRGSVPFAPAHHYRLPSRSGVSTDVVAQV